MPGPVLHVGAAGTCPHVGMLSIAPGNPRVMLSRMPVATAADVSTIAGCIFQVPIPGGTKPQPCVTANWLMPATRVMAGGVPVLLATQPGICQSAEQIPAGPVTIASVQPRVIAT